MVVRHIFGEPDASHSLEMNAPNNGVASVKTKFVSTDSSLLNDELSFYKDQWVPTIFTMDFFMHYQLQLLAYFLSLPCFGSKPVYLFRSIRGIVKSSFGCCAVAFPIFHELQRTLNTNMAGNRYNTENKLIKGSKKKYISHNHSYIRDQC